MTAARPAATAARSSFESATYLYTSPSIVTLQMRPGSGPPARSAPFSVSVRSPVLAATEPSTIAETVPPTIAAVTATLLSMVTVEAPLTVPS